MERFGATFYIVSESPESPRHLCETGEEDIPLLLNHFLEISRAATGKDVHGVSQDAMRALMEHSVARVTSGN